MLKTLLIVVVCIFSIQNITAQYGTERIEVKHYWNGYRLTVDEKKIKTSQALTMMMAIDTAAFGQLKAARRNSNVATVISGLGGLLIAYPLGTMIVGKEPQWSIAIVGAALAGLSIPFHSKARKQANLALDLYNAKVTYQPTAPKVNYQLVVNGLRAGIIAKF